MALNLLYVTAYCPKNALRSAVLLTGLSAFVIAGTAQAAEKKELVKEPPVAASAIAQELESIEKDAIDRTQQIMKRPDPDTALAAEPEVIKDKVVPAVETEAAEIINDTIIVETPDVPAISNTPEGGMAAEKGIMTTPMDENIPVPADSAPTDLAKDLIEAPEKTVTPELPAAAEDMAITGEDLAVTEPVESEEPQNEDIIFDDSAAAAEEITEDTEELISSAPEETSASDANITIGEDTTPSTEETTIAGEDGEMDAEADKPVAKRWWGRPY